MFDKEISDLSIIGKQPPPIGGVTIHVDRLVSSLKQSEIKFSFYNLNNFRLIELLAFIRTSKLIHLHSSKPILRLAIAIVCFVLRKKLISTIHGNLGRYNTFFNVIDYLAIIITRYPITLNKLSQNLAFRLNSKSRLVPAFIPPLKVEPLDVNIRNKINILKKNRKQTFCTNAFDVTWDKNNIEIYGISNLVLIFSNYPDLGLVVSDPSGNYLSYLNNIGIKIPSNIVFITEIHCFVEVIKLVDTFLRTTTTDGDSLSVKEALFYNKRVIASDCTNRPTGTILYKTGNNESLIAAIHNSNISPAKYTILNGFKELEKIYIEILQ